MSKMVQKQYANMLLLVVVFGLSVGGYFLYQKYATPGNKGEDAQVRKNILTYQKDDIKEIQITSFNGEMALLKNDSGFYLKSDPGLPLDSDEVDKLVNNISKLDSDKIVGENLSEMSEYGLAVPKHTLQIKLKDNSSRILEIGDVTPRGNGYYLKEKGSKTVYIVSSDVVLSFMPDRDKLRSKKLFAFKKEDVEQIAFSKGEKKIFQAQRGAGAEATKWSMKEPAGSKPNESEINSTLDKIVASKVTQFIGTSSEGLSQYGLDQPSGVIELTLKGNKKQKLYFGKLEQSPSNGNDGGYQPTVSSRYLKIEGDKELYLVESSRFDFLDKNTDAFVTK